MKATNLSLMFVVLCFVCAQAFGQDLFGPSEGLQEPRPIPTSITVPSNDIEGARVLAPDVFLIESGRPLEAAASLLERRLGIAISVEEPAWLAPSDSVRASDHPDAQDASRRFPQWAGPLVPRGGAFGPVSLPTISESRDLSLQAIQERIEAVVAQYMAAGNPGRFRIEALDVGEFSIIPTSILNESGDDVVVTPILDTRISFPEADRTLRETLDIVYQTVTRASGQRVVNVDPFPTRFFTSTRIILGARNEAARDVLRKALTVPGGPLYSFRVRYDPELQVFGIWHNPVYREVVIDTETRLQQLVWPADTQ